MENLQLKEDIKTLLKGFFNNVFELIEDKWKEKAYIEGKSKQEDIDKERKKVQLFAQVLYEEYLNKIDITTQFIESNVESIKPYHFKYNIRRFWFREADAKIAIAPNEILVSQEGVKVILKEGEYTNGGELESIEPIKDPKDVRDFVYVYRPQKFFTQKNNMYVYTHGEFLLRNYDEPIIRFYFSLEPRRESVQQFIEKIKDFFNERRIPFNMKTPLKLQNFGRSDTLVLYLAQNHYFYVREFINELRNFALKKVILRTNIPLFVKEIYQGIGFAEDPYFVDDSFGNQRVKLIIKVINDQLDLKQKVTIDSILKGIANEGYNVKEFYRNPHTNFDYNFENFSEPISLNPQYKFKVGNPYYFFDYNKLALEYALDLIGRAVWNNENESKLIWFSYKEDDGKNERYKVISEDESNDIYWFLSKIVQIKSNRRYFTDAILKIIDDKTIQNESNDNYKKRVDNIQKKIYSDIGKLENLTFEDFENNYDNLTTNIKKWSDIDELRKFADKQKTAYHVFTSKVKSSFLSIFQKKFDNILPSSKEMYEGEIEDLNKDETKKIAAAIYPFAKIEYPIPNKFDNYEYCPTDEGRLRVASFMLRVYCPSLFEKTTSAVLSR